MRKKTGLQKKCFLVFLISLFLLGTILPIYALELNYPIIPGAEAPQIFTETAPPEEILPLYIKYFYNLILIIGVMAAVGMMVLGGFRYLTSLTSPAGITDAKETIFAGILGLIILFGSYVILHTINPQLTSLRLEKTPVEDPGIEPPPPPELRPETMVFFQVPLGKIIERALFEMEGETGDKLKVDIENLEEKSEGLKQASENLKDFLTKECSCGMSDCLETGGECQAIGCNPACDEAKKQEKIARVEEAIEDLEQAKETVMETVEPLRGIFKELKKAGFLVSLLIDDMQDYANMGADKHFLEELGIVVEYEYFPEWEDIRTEFHNQPANDPATLYFLKDRDNEILIEKAAAMQ